MKTLQLKCLFIIICCSACMHSYGQIKFEDLHIDTAITGFKYSADFQGTHVYTPNGHADLNAINPSAFSFTILPNTTYKDALLQITYMLKMSTDNGYTHADIIQKDTTINGNTSYYTTITETLKGTDYKNFIFHAFTMKGTTAILFISGDLDNGKYIEQFKKTFYAVKL